MENRATESLPTQAKKQKLAEDTTDAERPPTSRVFSKASEFPVNDLEDFYKPCPSYRLPLEIGAFSVNEEGSFRLDRSQLRYYTPPSRLNLDLRVGYASFVPKKENVPAHGLEPMLRWISDNGDCFRPRANPKSPDKNGEVSRRGSFSEQPVPAKSKERPDNLLTNFVSWRGMFTKILCSPYNKTEPWRLAATLYNGTIYLREIETEEAKEKTATETPRLKEMSYWGVKFEDYMTSTKEPPSPSRGGVTAVASPADKSGTVNPNQAYCTVVRTRMNTHSVVMAAEVDCYDHISKEKPPQNYIELKTSRSILTDRNQASFKRYKLMKWWAQSFLVGVPRIVCGFRNDDGIVKNLQTFKTAEIPRETQTDLSLWQPSVCLNFLDELLTWIRKMVVEDDPKVVYVIEWRRPFTYVSCIQCPSDSEHIFLPDWYLQKLTPPQD